MRWLVLIIISVAVLLCIFFLLPKHRAVASVKFRVDDLAPYHWIPRIYTCHGKNINPEIEILHLPPGTRYYAVLLYDPDAPGGTFYHWLLFDVPASIHVIPPGLPKQFRTDYGYQGYNDFGWLGYGGPCPPPGKPHHYHFLVLALKAKIPPKPYRPKQFLDLVQQYVVGKGEVVLLYGTSKS
ncbi:MAG: YbhB/YbcL family Raf kinase inhibitor-like protein [bacterium]|nr:YbhB/YbcL family Raf kinase inhibitor-like protein [bacterium]